MRKPDVHLQIKRYDSNFFHNLFTVNQSTVYMRFKCFEKEPKEKYVKIIAQPNLVGALASHRLAGES